MKTNKKIKEQNNFWVSVYMLSIDISSKKNSQFDCKFTVNG